MYAGDSLDWARGACESMLHMAGQAQYVCVCGGGGVHGVVEKITVHMLVGAHEGQTGENPGCAKMVPLCGVCHLNWTKRECKKGRDKRARITPKKKRSSSRESPTQIDNPSW